MNPELSNVDTEQTKENNERRYGRDFFDLQFRFAKEMQRITEKPFEKCLLEYTNIYKRLRLGHDMNPNNPKWKEFIEALGNSNHGPEVAAQFCEKAEKEKLDTKEESKEQSCFRYDYNPKTRSIKIHFDNNDTDENGPLGENRFFKREEELKKIFSEIKQSYPEAENVRGSSWLYNLNSYRRLFPVEYTAQPIENPGGLNDLGIWGQFIDKDGHVKQDMETVLFNKLKDITLETEVLNIFSFRKLDVKCDIKYFYSKFGIV